MAPHWFELAAWAALGLGFASALVIAADIVLLGNRQHMPIMNLVFPLSALYMGPVAVLAYFARGRRMSHRQMHMRGVEPARGHEARDSWWQVSLSDSHCGAGCALGDIGGEWVVWAIGWMIGSLAHFESLVSQVAEVIAARGEDGWPDVEFSIPVPGGPISHW